MFLCASLLLCIYMRVHVFCVCVEASEQNYICVCMRQYVYACEGTCVYADVRISVRLYVYMCLQVCTSLYLYVCDYVYTLGHILLCKLLEKNWYYRINVGKISRIDSSEKYIP